jgi:hypothetical protein
LGPVIFTNIYVADNIPLEFFIKPLYVNATKNNIPIIASYFKYYIASFLFKE